MSELSIPENDWMPCWEQLESLYSEPHRQYHNLTHISHFLSTMEKLTNKPSEAQRLAAFYHDVIYDPKRKDNEELSAKLANDVLKNLNLFDSLGDPVRLLIMATVSHDYASAVDAASKLPHSQLTAEEIAVFLDSDLAILGSRPAAYDEYSRKIEQEYSHVPPADFAKGRSGFLSSFLASGKQLFHSDRGRSLFDAQARQNMTREAVRLSSRISS